ncbi:hypothetical protein KM043_016230 [Ampulex compressa]|nr:hypothetical protein KM043_016230 [Ampulex compressa]
MRDTRRKATKSQSVHVHADYKTSAARNTIPSAARCRTAHDRITLKPQANHLLLLELIHKFHISTSPFHIQKSILPYRLRGKSHLQLLLISLGHGDGLRYRQRRGHVAVTQGSRNPRPYWEHMLREVVFKTFSPSPSGNYAMYKHLLEAPLYDGPLPVDSKDEVSLVLSRGDIYYMPNDRWVLCQESCTDCEACTRLKNPTAKWILRRIKRHSSHGSSRYDLQITIIPQEDGSFHMRNLWPRSYVYVTTQGEQAAYSMDDFEQEDGAIPLSRLDDGLEELHRGSGKFWHLVDSTTNRYVEGREQDSDGTEDSLMNETRKTAVSTIEPEKEEVTEQRHRPKNVRRQRPRPKSVDRFSTVGPSTDGPDQISKGESGRLEPKLILGTDRQGQKHLVHVVPAVLTTSTIPVDLSVSAASSGTSAPRTSEVIRDHERSAYQRILRRIFDSLQNHKRSIESFLEPTANKTLQGQELIASETGDPRVGERRHRSRTGFADSKQGERFHRQRQGTDRNESLWDAGNSLALARSRQRRKSWDDDNQGTMNNVTEDIAPKQFFYKTIASNESSNSNFDYANDLGVETNSVTSSLREKIREGTLLIQPLFRLVDDDHKRPSSILDEDWLGCRIAWRRFGIVSEAVKQNDLISYNG